MATLISTQQACDHSDAEQIYDPVHIQDPIHGYMVIPDRIKTLIDTPHFQRLRHLKQLGTSYYVFPGASHNRFEHCLGVMHLARKLLKKIADRQPKLKITKHEMFCVSAAGLLHDLGHGPFSHVFDNEFVPSITHRRFRHETMSVLLIKDLFVSNKIAIDDAHLELIQALVSPSTHEDVYQEYKDKQRGFLFEIVANDLTGIDVDKWDYFLRDSQNTGIGISFTYCRLMEHVRVINDHICWSEKTSFELYEMFRTRYELFKRIYAHKAGKSIALLICDILKFANPVFDVIGKIDDCRKYLTLNDTILQMIELKEIDDTKPGMKELRKAQELIRRLHRRDLYKCCGYLLLSPEYLVKFNPKPPSSMNGDNDNHCMITPPQPIKRRNGALQANEEKDGCDNASESHAKIAYKEIEREWAAQIYAMYEKYELQLAKCDTENEDKREGLKPSDIVVNIMSLSFGMETQHPMEKVFLYNSKNPQMCYQVHCEQIITMTGKYKEVVIRAYVKKSEWKQECRYLFSQFLKQKGIIDADCDANVQESSVLSPHINKKSLKKGTLRQSNENLDFKRKLSTTFDSMVI